MPATATITSFFTFVAGKKARAGQVNTNFSNFRGTMVPINTDTATASNGLFDLGAPTHEWRNIYLTNSPIVGGQPLGALVQVQSMVRGTNPPEVLTPINGITRLKFVKNRSRDIRFSSPMINFAVGNQIKLRVHGTYDTAPSGFTLRTETSLLTPFTIGSFTTGATSPNTTTVTNIHTSTVNIIAATNSSGFFFTDENLALTDSNGLIGGVTVTGSDQIAVQFFRTGDATADSLAGNVILIDLLYNFNG